MTNGVKELDMPKEFKSVAEQLKAMYNALKKWPFMMGITILMFVLLISSEYLTDNEFILFLQIIGFADFNQPTLKLIIQLYTAFLFIFDACIIPDFLSSIDPQKNKNECVSNELKEKIEKLEKEIEELKKFEKKTD